MFRKEGLEEIKADIERAEDIHSLKGIATAMVATTEHAAQEVERLKAELELRTRERDQAIELLTESENIRVDLKLPDEVQILSRYYDGDDECWASANYCLSKPDLFAHLAGRGGGDV